MVKTINCLKNEKPFQVTNENLVFNGTRKIDFEKKKLVVYTAISGEYDELETPQFVNANFDYVVFTDNKNLKSDFWEIRLMDGLNLDYMRKARNYKILPHLYLSEYDYSLWIDANIKIIGNLEDFIDKYVKNSPIMCITHPVRECIYEEAKACADLGKDYEITIAKQINKYKMEGFPENRGLIASGILFREHNNHQVINLMNDWYDEVIVNSKRDQLSFNYVCWKNRFDYDYVYFNDTFGKYFQLKKHKKKAGNHTAQLGEYGLNRMWKDLISPIIEGINSNYIVEIGSDRGLNTVNILEYCVDNNACMTAIDPSPKFDIKEFKAKYKDKFEIYQELSLSKLPLLEDYDVILIDGDHNWYTVYNELKIIEKTFKGKEFPVVFLHDVSWPYGRRDLYYNPENIPECYRQPYKKLGISPGQSTLKEDGGINYTLCNSIYENNPKNGVLTAVEDFIDESDLQLSLKIIKAFYGLGILYPNDSVTEEIVEDTLNKSKLVEALEEERVKLTVASDELRGLNKSLQKKTDESRIKLKNTENQLVDTRKQLDGTKNQLVDTRKQLDDTKNQLNKQNAQISKLKADIYEMSYDNNQNRPFIQRAFSRFPILYILFNTNETGIKNALVNLKGFKAIKKNNLLDVGYYLKNYGDVRLSGMDPTLHYIYYGFKESRKPNPKFNGDHYLKTHQDVKKSNLNPLVHYSLYGMKEGRKTGHANQNRTNKKRTRHIKKNLTETDEQKKKVKVKNKSNPLTNYDKIKGNINITNNARVIITGWVAKIGGKNPREAFIKIDNQTFEVSCQAFKDNLGGNKISEGKLRFEFFVPYKFVDGEKHQLKFIDKTTGKLIAQKEVIFNQIRDYQDFSGFLANSLLSPIVSAPFREQDKRCFATMENIKKHLLTNTQSNKKLPLVSVILDSKDNFEGVQSTLDSVLKQTYPNIELIVIADNEDDELKQLVECIDNVNVVFPRKHDEFLNARNLGLTVANGEYVAYLDSNNTWDPLYIEAMIGAFLELPDAEALYCGQLLFKDKAKKPYAIRYGSLNRPLLNNRNYIDLNSFCHKSTILSDVGYFDENMGSYADWDWIMRVVETSQVYSIPILLSNCFYDTLDKQYSDHDEKFSYLREKQKERINNNDKGFSYDLNKKAHHKVSVIIPSFEALEDLKECIRSIINSNSNDFLEIILVDNASNARVRDYLKELAAQGIIKLIQNDVNYGFTYAVKQGISISEPGNDILILNNDAILEQGAIRSMQKTAYEIPDCGLVVPQQILIDRGSSKYSVPYADLRFQFDVNASRLYSNIINVPFFHSGNLLELNFAPFFCVYIKRDVYQRSVGLDDELGRHARSDRIFCNYIRHVMKLKIYQDTNAMVYHMNHSSTDELRSLKPKFEIMVRKNQWEEETAKKLGYETATWDV